MPLAALVGWVASCAVAGRFTTGTIAIILALAGIAAWVGLLVGQRKLRQRSDRGAYEHLQLLQDRTCQPGVRLLAVIGTDWANQAGQAAATVEVNTGTVGTEWFPLAMFPHGSMVLVSTEAGAPRLLDWMPPVKIQAAHRYRLHEAMRTRLTLRRRWRRRRRSLISEIETVLRQHSDATAPGTARPAHRTDRDPDRSKETP